MTSDAAAWPAGAFDGIARTDSQPLYRQLARRIEALIRNGSVPAGSRLEDEVSLAARLSVSRPTVRSAIQDLVDKGLLVRRRGAGTQVVQSQITRGLEFTSLYEDLRAADHVVATTVLVHEIIPASDEVARELRLAAGEPVLRLKRSRASDGVPLAVLENFLPPTFATIAASELEEHGLYEALREAGVSLRIARQSIGARRVTEREGQLLGLDPGAPVLTMKRTAYDHSGAAVEFGRHCYRPDAYNFETMLVSR